MKEGGREGTAVHMVLLDDREVPADYLGGRNVYRSSVGLLILAKTFHPTRSVRASPVRGPSKEEDR